MIYVKLMSQNRSQALIAKRVKALKPSENHDRLIGVARRLFAEKGYAGVSIDDICDGAKITRGALYYQFTDKQGLFEAVARQLTGELGQALFDQTMEKVTNLTDELAQGAQILLRLYAKSEIRQVLLIDGPSVMGVNRWTEMQRPVSIALVEHALGHLADHGTINRADIPGLATLLFGAMIQAGLAIGTATAPAAEQRRLARAFALITDRIAGKTNQRATA
jgi:AcrR family transcriptional regulator